MPGWRNSCLPVGRGIRVPPGRDSRKIARHEFESHLIYAAVAELVYAPVLGTGSRKGLGVRVSPAAPVRKSQISLVRLASLGDQIVGNFGRKNQLAVL